MAEPCVRFGTLALASGAGPTAPNRTRVWSQRAKRRHRGGVSGHAAPGPRARGYRAPGQGHAASSPVPHAPVAPAGQAAPGPRAPPWGSAAADQRAKWRHRSSYRPAGQGHGTSSPALDPGREIKPLAKLHPAAGARSYRPRAPANRPTGQATPLGRAGTGPRAKWRPTARW